MKLNLLKLINEFNIVLTSNIFVDDYGRDHFVIKFRGEAKKGDKNAIIDFKELSETLDGMTDEIYSGNEH